jgi:hypothetical protein
MDGQSQKGIKEISELLDGVKLLAVEAKKVMGDGKVDAKDLPVLFDLVKNLGVLGEALKGAGEIPAEAKDLSTAELQALGAKVLEIAAAIKVA